MTSTASSAADMAALSTRERISRSAAACLPKAVTAAHRCASWRAGWGSGKAAFTITSRARRRFSKPSSARVRPASSASRLEEPRYRQLSRQPAAFCRQFALDLVAQWSDPREHQFQKVITAERNRVPGIRAKFADQFYSREQRLMTDYFRGFALGRPDRRRPTRARWLGCCRPADLHPPRTLRHGRRSRRRMPRSWRRSITSSHSSCHCWRQKTLPDLI